MVVDNLYALGGLSQRQGFDGPVIGKKMATQNKRDLSPFPINLTDKNRDQFGQV